jgi:hypothetical protein
VTLPPSLFQNSLLPSLMAFGVFRSDPPGFVLLLVLHCPHSSLPSSFSTPGLDPTFSHHHRLPQTGARCTHLLLPSLLWSQANLRQLSRTLHFREPPSPPPSATYEPEARAGPCHPPPPPPCSSALSTWPSGALQLCLFPPFPQKPPLWLDGGIALTCTG